MGPAVKTLAVEPQCREFIFGRALRTHEESDRVQVWTIDLKSNRDAVAELRTSLSQDEIARADEFRFENGRTADRPARAASLV